MQTTCRIVAVDHGNSQIKTCHNTFPSGVIKTQNLPSQATEIIKWNGYYYVLDNGRCSYRKDKTKDDVFFVLTLFAIARELDLPRNYSPEMPIALAVGLPPQYMMNKTDTDAWGKFFREKSKGSRIVFEYSKNGKQLREYAFTLEKVNVSPQAYTVVILDKQTFEQQSSHFIVDIGGFTTDVLEINNGKTNLRNCNSLELGVIALCSNAIKQVLTDTGIKIREEYVLDYMRTGKEDRPEVKKAMDIAIDEYTQRLFGELKAYCGIELESDNITFIGGGTAILKEKIQKESKDSSRITYKTNERINAIGYQKIMEMVLARKVG